MLRKHQKTLRHDKTGGTLMRTSAVLSDGLRFACPQDFSHDATDRCWAWTVPVAERRKEPNGDCAGILILIKEWQYSRARIMKL